MLYTEKQPVNVGEILVEEFLEPMNLTQVQLAQMTGLPRKHINELCKNRREVTADTALILSRVFGNSADFWLNTQRRDDIWNALHDPRRLERVERAIPISSHKGFRSGKASPAPARSAAFKRAVAAKKA